MLPELAEHVNILPTYSDIYLGLFSENKRIESSWGYSAHAWE